MSISGVNLITCPKTLINQKFISSRQNRQLVQSYPEIPYHYSVINSCLSGKLLGVTVNNILSWSDHIETVIKKSNTYLYILSRISQLTIVNAFIMLMFTLILIYVCVIWGNCTQSLEEKIV